MKIAVFGTGMVGKLISSKLAELGHDVTLGTRNIENTLNNDKVNSQGKTFKDWFTDQKHIKLETFDGAAKQSELLINCTGGMISLDVLLSIETTNLTNKILIDIANPLDFSNGMPPSLNPVNTTSLGEQIQAKFPMLQVVKTLNTMTAPLMVNPGTLKGEHHVFVCGNDEKSKQQTKEILNGFGWKNNQILDLGDITNARGTEMLLPIWLRIWGALGTAEFNFHIQQN